MSEWLRRETAIPTHIGHPSEHLAMLALWHKLSQQLQHLSGNEARARLDAARERLAIGVAGGSRNENAKNLRVGMTRDEGLVLYAWLTREDDRETLPVEHAAEQNSLWELEAQLDRVLTEPFGRDYEDAVEAARTRLAADNNLPREGL